MVQKNVLIFYFRHPIYARTTRYEKAFLSKGKKRPRSLRSFGLASLDPFYMLEIVPKAIGWIIQLVPIFIILRPRPHTYASTSPLVLLQLHQQQQLLSINIINSTIHHLQHTKLRILLQHLTSHAAYERSGGPPKRPAAKRPCNTYYCYQVRIPIRLSLTNSKLICSSDQISVSTLEGIACYYPAPSIMAYSNLFTLLTSLQSTSPGSFI